MESETVNRLTFFEFPVHYVVPTTALGISTVFGHKFRNFLGKIHIALIRFNVVDAGQIPRNLQIVSNHAPVLLPAPLLVKTPVFMEFFLHKRTVFIVLKMVCNRVGCVHQHIQVGFFARCQQQVDQVGRCVVTHRVPVLT